jgi:hypothetical protein
MIVDPSTGTPAAAEIAFIAARPSKRSAVQHPSRWIALISSALS